METPLQSLTQVSSLLHLTHHRNSNQHRLAKWYKSFSQLRRHVRKLIGELEALDTAVKFSERGQGGEDEENKYVRKARERVEGRVEFLQKRLIEECYLAFSNLVADNQYSAMGLMLIATLARVQAVIRPLGKDDGDDIAIEEDETRSLKKEATIEAGDLGEVVSREEISKPYAGDEELDEDPKDIEILLKKSSKKRKLEKAKRDLGEQESKMTINSMPTKKVKKKKKKGGDAFDDLFAGLL